MDPSDENAFYFFFSPKNLDRKIQQECALVSAALGHRQQLLRLYKIFSAKVAYTNDGRYKLIFFTKYFFIILNL